MGGQQTNLAFRFALVLCGVLLAQVMSGCGRSDPQPVSGVDARGESSNSDPANADPSNADPKPTPLPALLPAEELADGWLSLFDGQTLFGWQADSNANWHVADGAIVVSEGEKGFLRTTCEFADYVLKLEFRSAPGTNSGIFLHLGQEQTDPETNCYELNIADSDNPFPTCSLVGREKVEGDFDSTDWQAYEVVVEGGRVSIKLDGQPVLDYVDENPLWRGQIGLQLNEGKVEFRNIKIKPLSQLSIFNGEDLEGWNTFPEMATEFSVNEQGHLRVRNTRDGRGQLETHQIYGDFVMRFECMTHAPNLNSGIFFRCIPGEEMNGYESQIHNGFQNGDRGQPVDCGTGGIFRRQDARVVIPDDLAWFHKTIIVTGPHMSVWVNGYQVSDWTDERTPHQNPREGLRTEPGTIMIQGHDETTDLSFREMYASELPERRAAVAP